MVWLVPTTTHLIEPTFGFTLKELCEEFLLKMNWLKEIHMGTNGWQISRILFVSRHKYEMFRYVHRTKLMEKFTKNLLKNHVSDCQQFNIHLDWLDAMKRKKKRQRPTKLDTYFYTQAHPHSQYDYWLSTQFGDVKTMFDWPYVCLHLYLMASNLSLTHSSPSIHNTCINEYAILLDQTTSTYLIFNVWISTPNWPKEKQIPQLNP